MPHLAKTPIHSTPCYAGTTKMAPRWFEFWARPPLKAACLVRSAAAQVVCVGGGFLAEALVGDRRGHLIHNPPYRTGRMARGDITRAQHRHGGFLWAFQVT